MNVNKPIKYKKFALRFKELRNMHNLSQASLGEILGISQKTISAYEKGNILPSNEMWEKITSYFNVSLDYLMGNTDIITPYLDTSPVSPDQIRTIAANTGDADGDSITSDFPEISEEQQKRNRLAYKILNSDYSADEIDKIEAMIDLLVKK